MRYLLLCCLLGACTSLNRPDKSDELTFRHVLNHFVYVDQSKQKDVLKVSYEILNNKQFYGDCDDFALTLGYVFMQQGVDGNTLRVMWHLTPDTSHMVLLKDGFIYANNKLFPIPLEEYKQSVAPEELVDFGSMKNYMQVLGLTFGESNVKLGNTLKMRDAIVKTINTR